MLGGRPSLLRKRRDVLGKGVFTAVGVAAIAVQAIVLTWISSSQFRTFALTVDFSIYQHAFVEIARGNFRPDATYVGGLFFQNHGEAIMWPIAIAFRAFEPAATLLGLQNLAVLGVSMLTMAWIRSLVDRSPESWDAPNTTIASVAIAITALDPWIVWSNAQDFHFEAFASLLLLAALFAFDRGKVVLGWLAVLACMLCGDVSTTYVVGLAVFLLCHRGARRYSGLGIIAVAVVWLGYLRSLEVKRGAALPALYGHLVPGDPHATDSALHLAFAVLTHPFQVLQALSAQALNIYANLSPGGLVGIFSPWALAIGGIALLENNLIRGQLFSQPSFQSLPIYSGLGIGTFAVLLWVRRRISPRWAAGLAVVLLLNSAAWNSVVVPHVKLRWLAVGPGATHVLGDAYYGTSHSTQMVSSQGVVGRFGAFAISGFFNQGLALRTEPLTVLVTPYDGINTLDVNADFANLMALIRDGSEIVEQDRGAWWLRYNAPLGDPHLFLPYAAPVIEAWVVAASHARPVLRGPESDWHLESVGSKGYVLDRDYWRYPLGPYEAQVEMNNTGPVMLEILNASDKSLIFRRPIAAGPRRRLAIPFDHTIHVEERVFRGSGFFQFDPLPPPKNNALEVRVWTNGKPHVDIYQVGIIPSTRRNLFK